MSSIEEATTEEEELCLDRQYPWQCWSDGLRTFKQYKTIGEMATDLGLHVSQIQQAIIHTQGNFGGFHFVKR